jgi:hypothetical protein
MFTLAYEVIIKDGGSIVQNRYPGNMSFEFTSSTGHRGKKITGEKV